MCGEKWVFLLIPCLCLLVVWWLAGSLWLILLQNGKKDLLVFKSIAEFKNERKMAVKCICMCKGENLWVHNFQKDSVLKLTQSWMMERICHCLCMLAGFSYSAASTIFLLSLLIRSVPSAIFSRTNLSVMVWTKVVSL